MTSRALCLFVLALGAAAACAPEARKSSPSETARDTRDRRVLAENVAAGWSDRARVAARALIEKYGAPDEVRSARVVWLEKGPWKKTVVRDLPPPYAGSETTELGVVEQTIEYAITPEQAAPLEAFGDTVAANTRRRELTVRSDSEAVNFLRVNLVDDVVNHRLTVDQARASYARILALEAAGKTTRYTRSVRFK
jgi:hypothetical protein